MTPAAKRRGTLLGAATAGLVVAAVLAFRPHAGPAPAPLANAVDVPAADDAPYHQRRDFPRRAEAEPSAEPTAPPTPATADLPPALTHSPVAPPPADDERPAPSPAQTTTQWIAGYREAVCGCRTRNCVRDLQGRFLNALSTTDYVAERDQDSYTEASRAAIRCYAALPEGS